MNDAKNRTPKCTHGVAILLDKDHSCFECEKQALSLGLPIQLRMMDGANAMLLHAHLQATELAKQPGPAPTAADFSISGTPWSGPAIQKLIDDLKAPRDINGDPWPRDPRACPPSTDAAELKALQRVIIDMRRELTEVSSDRDAFARENFELLAQVSRLREKLRAVRDIVTPNTDCN